MMTLRTLVPGWPDWFDRGEIPPPVEDASESAWAEYSSCWQELDDKLPKYTARSRHHAGARMRAAEREIMVEQPPYLNADEAMKIVRRNERVCPVGRVWRDLYLLLPVKNLGHQLRRAPYPIDSASMRSTTDLNKQLRLREQLEWAECTGVLAEVVEFLEAMEESDWHHFNARAWPSIAP
jgi:hypothetical protein